MGLANDNFIEVKTGLEEGVEVLLYNPEIGRERQDEQPEEDESETDAPAPGGPGAGAKPSQ